MKFIKKLMAQGRIRSARKRLEEDPSPKNYVALAQEHVRLGSTRETLAVCDQGLEAFPGNALILRLRERATRMQGEERMGQIKKELAQAPAARLYAEMCDIHVEMERVERAEETAREWIAFEDGPEPRLALARARAARFFADRGRELGQAAVESIDDAVARLKDDPRGLELRYEFLNRIGAWGEARDAVASLLEHKPGNTELEGRFRTLECMVEDAPTCQRALLEVERTGLLPGDEESGQKRAGVAGQVRPVLRDLAASPEVEAAIYMRGATVLIQGPRGATAERTARSLRTILTSGRATARRLGLGRIFQVQLEGDFGQLNIAPGDSDAGAIWSRGALGREREETLLGLAGLNVDLEGATS